MGPSPKGVLRDCQALSRALFGSSWHLDGMRLDPKQEGVALFGFLSHRELVSLDLSHLLTGPCEALFVSVLDGLRVRLVEDRR
jgi:hypothetical protein